MRFPIIPQTSKRTTWQFAIAHALWIGVSAAVFLCADEPEVRRRAKWPDGKDRHDSSVFFENIFDVLVGPRPTRDNSASSTMTPTPSGSEEPTVSGERWSSIISATVLEDEVKALNMSLRTAITTPSEFAARGHKAARRDFALLAALFGVIADYDGSVRWKDNALVARDRFARAAANAKAGGNSNVYQEAKLRLQDLQDLVRGSSLDGDGKDEDARWGDLLDRAPLMQRLELAQEERLASIIANESNLAAGQEQAVHEAEIVALIGTLLVQPSMEDAGDDEYDGHARAMIDGALRTRQAALDAKLDAIRAAVGDVGKACGDCHESYR